MNDDDTLRRHDPDPSARLNAVLALPDDSTACGPLLGAVGDTSLDVARAALRRLEPIAGDAEKEALREMMLTLDIGVVGDVAAALRRLGDSGAAPLAVAALPSPRCRQKAVLALRELRDPIARTSLIETLDDPDSAVRRLALEALAGLPSEPATVASCRKNLGDLEPSVRAAAVTAVAVLDPAARSSLRALVDDPQPRVRRAVAAAVPVLDDGEVTALLGDDAADVRVATLHQLVRHPRPQLLTALLAALSDSSWQVRCAACEALAATDRREAAEALVRVLVDAHRTVRRWALIALERLLGDSLEGVLERELCSRPPPDLRRALVETLGSRGAVGHVPVLARDPDPTVRIAVAHALAHADSPEARAALHDLAVDPDSVVRNAAAVVLQAAHDREG